MVGLPARGKTYIAKKLTRYLNWIGITTRGKKIFESLFYIYVNIDRGYVICIQNYLIVEV